MLKAAISQHLSAQGMLGKLLGWLSDDGFSPSGSGGGRMGRAPSGGAPDFTALTEDPDQRRRRQQQTQQQPNSQRESLATFRRFDRKVFL